MTSSDKSMSKPAHRPVSLSVEFDALARPSGARRSISEQMRAPSLRQLRGFQAVAQHANFSRAADALALS
jgi:hypothetical protein